MLIRQTASEGEPTIAVTALVELQRTLYSSRNRTRNWLHRSRRQRVELAVDHLASLAVERPNLDLVIDDIAHSTPEPSSFDLVSCSEVIERTTAPAEVVAGLRRLLRPGGTLVLTTPQARSTLEPAAKIAFRPGVIDPVRLVYGQPILPTGHSSLLTARQVEALLTGNGFRILERQSSIAERAR